MSIQINSQGTKEIKSFYVENLLNIEEILNYVKYNPAIINISALSSPLKQRVIDIITGAIYMCNLNICPLDKDNYLIIKKDC